MVEPTLHGGDNETARVLGRLEAKVAAIEDRIERLEASSAGRMSVIESKLDMLVHALAQSQGAMKLVHWCGGAAFAVLGYLANSFIRQSR